MTPVRDCASAFTPSGHGMVTLKHPSIDQIEMIPNVPAGDLSSISNGSEMDGFLNMGYNDKHQIDGPGALVLDQYQDKKQNYEINQQSKLYLATQSIPTPPINITDTAEKTQVSEFVDKDDNDIVVLDSDRINVSQYYQLFDKFLSTSKKQ